MTRLLDQQEFSKSKASVGGSVMIRLDHAQTGIASASSHHRFACLAPHKTFPRSGALVARSFAYLVEKCGDRDQAFVAAVG